MSLCKPRPRSKRVSNPLSPHGTWRRGFAGISVLGQDERLGFKGVVDLEEHVQQVARRHDETVRDQKVLEQLNVCTAAVTPKRPCAQSRGQWSRPSTRRRPCKARRTRAGVGHDEGHERLLGGAHEDLLARLHSVLLGQLAGGVQFLQLGGVLQQRDWRGGPRACAPSAASDWYSGAGVRALAYASAWPT